MTTLGSLSGVFCPQRGVCQLNQGKNDISRSSGMSAPLDMGMYMIN